MMGMHGTVVPVVLTSLSSTALQMKNIKVFAGKEVKKFFAWNTYHHRSMKISRHQHKIIFNQKNNR